MKKIFKLAVLRSDSDNICPFGLSIPFGCQNAGELINKMAPTNYFGEESTIEEEEAIADANNRLLMWSSEDVKGRCIYADKIIENKDIVECNWNSDDLTQNSALQGSPYYYKHFSGTGLDGLYSVPLGYYTDNSIDRGMFHGMYSLEASANKENKKEDDNNK